MQIDIQETGPLPDSFQFAVTILVWCLPERLLWKTTDSQIMAVISTSAPSLTLFHRPQSLLPSYNSAYPMRATMNVALLSSFYLVPSVLYLMEINPHS